MLQRPRHRAVRPSRQPRAHRRPPRAPAEHEVSVRAEPGRVVERERPTALTRRPDCPFAPRAPATLLTAYAAHPAAELRARAARRTLVGTAAPLREALAEARTLPGLDRRAIEPREALRMQQRVEPGAQPAERPSGGTHVAQPHLEPSPPRGLPPAREGRFEAPYEAVDSRKARAHFGAHRAVPVDEPLVQQPLVRPPRARGPLFGGAPLLGEVCQPAAPARCGAPVEGCGGGEALDECGCWPPCRPRARRARLLPHAQRAAARARLAPEGARRVHRSPRGERARVSSPADPALAPPVLAVRCRHLHQRLRRPAQPPPAVRPTRTQPSPCGRRRCVGEYRPQPCRLELTRRVCSGVRTPRRDEARELARSPNCERRRRRRPAH